jgi:hypothetical protein
VLPIFVLYYFNSFSTKFTNCFSISFLTSFVKSFFSFTDLRIICNVSCLFCDCNNAFFAMSIFSETIGSNGSTQNTSFATSVKLSIGSKGGFRFFSFVITSAASTVSATSTVAEVSLGVAGAIGLAVLTCSFHSVFATLFLTTSFFCGVAISSSGSSHQAIIINIFL